MFTQRKWAVSIGVLILLALAAYCAYAYLYQGARQVSKETAEMTVKSAEIIDDYETDIQLADKKYLNKVIEVGGTVSAVTDSVLTLDSVIFCGLGRAAGNGLVGKTIKVKGRCIGFDELFNEVKLDQCTVVE